MLFPFYISYLWSSGVKRNSESEHFRKTYALKNSSKCSSSVYEIFVWAENRLTYSFPLASRQNVTGLKKETVKRWVARQVREFDRSQTQGFHTMPCCLDLKKRSKSIITFLNWILSLWEVSIVFLSLTNSLSPELPQTLFFSKRFHKYKSNIKRLYFSSSFRFSIKFEYVLTRIILHFLLCLCITTVDSLTLSIPKFSSNIDQFCWILPFLPWVYH